MYRTARWLFWVGVGWTVVHSLPSFARYLRMRET
jgi:hypothetical protein